MSKFLSLTVVGLVLAACSGTPAPTPADPQPTQTEQPAAATLPAKVTKAVELARAIKASPDKAAEILSEAGMSKADLDALMYEIASDPKLSAAYTSALGG